MSAATPVVVSTFPVFTSDKRQVTEGEKSRFCDGREEFMFA